MSRRTVLGRAAAFAAVGLAAVMVAGCDVNAGTRTSAPQRTTLGAAANSGAGIATAVQTGNHQSDATPDKGTEKTGSGTETGR